MAIFTAISLLFSWKKIAELGMKAFAFSIEHWKEIAVALMLCTIIYQNTFEKRYFFWVNTIPYLQNVIAQQQEVIDEVVEANNTLSAAIETTNRQIEEWKQVSEQLERDNAALSGELKGLRQSTLDQVELILRGPTPVGCEAAIEYLRQGIPGLQFNNEVDVQ